MRRNDGHRLATVFTWAEAKSAGMSSRQATRTGMRVTRGVYAKDPTDLRMRMQSVLLTAGAKAAICGVTALKWAGVDIPMRLARDMRVWVQVPYSQHWPCRGEVRLVRPRQPAPITTIHQFPCVQLAYCWLEMAGECTIDELVELADAMTCRQHPVTTIKHMEELVAAAQAGTKGINRARTALNLARSGTDSIPETDLRLVLVRGGIPCPVVNLPIYDDFGEVMFWLDLADEETKTAIEYDGAIHVSDRRKMEADAKRRRFLEDHGWRVVTVTSADLVHNPAGVVDSVRRALTRT